MAKTTLGLVLFAVVFVCREASAQPKAPGQCPASSPTFGICRFDPNVNCLEDAQCQGGQLCCPNGCNKICKDPDNGQPADEQSPPTGPGLVVKHCPKPSSSGSFGICTYDESVNCLEDNECKNGQLCCSEGCNKVCKEPVTFEPIKPEPKVPLGPGPQVPEPKGPKIPEPKGPVVPQPSS